MSDVFDRIEKSLEFFHSQAAADEAEGKLTQETADKLREVGAIRLLQPKDFGGEEVHPVEWLENVLKIGSQNGAAGWVTGVVGVHPWELAQAPLEVQQDIWGDGELSPRGVDTWCASPYAPLGRATVVDGGVVFNGRWPFSSGTDHCDWILLGGVIDTPEGERGSMATDQRHFILPRSDYEILHESWSVVGLEGTGSKDVVVKDAFIPWPRVLNPAKFGEERARLGRDSTLYKLPLGVMFSGIIGAGTLALTVGALREFVDYTRTRVDSRGVAAVDSMGQLYALGEASADIKASVRVYLDGFNEIYKVAEATDGDVPAELRLEVRRDQVRAVHRAVEAVDKLFIHAGGSAVYRKGDFQRFWRDAHTARNHASNGAEATYEGYAKQLFGLPIPHYVRY